MIVFSLLHILPVVSFSLFSNPLHQFFTFFLVFGAIFGAKSIQKSDLQSFYNSIIEYRWSSISLILVVVIRIFTLPEDQSLVRGDIVSHIVPIIEWTDGKLGYPGIAYPRGFHGLFLTLSFGLEYSLVSHSVFITLHSIGWLFFLLIVRNHLGDIASSCVLLLAGGSGILGSPDGLIENTGWWLVRQSNLQPEISAWVFLLFIMWLIDNSESIREIGPKHSFSILGVVILGGATTNPFFFLVCSPFVLFWTMMTFLFNLGKATPSNHFQWTLISSPLLVLICSTILMEFTELRFQGTRADIHDASHRYDLLVAEFGTYFTDGLNVGTILVMLSPKPDLALGEPSISRMIILILIPSWYIAFFSLFSGNGRKEIGIYASTIVVIFLSWYWGIPAPDGWSVIRTQYPHRAFAMLMLVPIIKSLKEGDKMAIFIFTLLIMSIDHEYYFEPIFRYEHAARSISACILFLFAYKISEFLPVNDVNIDFIKRYLPMSFSLIVLGFWSSFNLVKFPDSDFGIMFFFGASLLIFSLYRTLPSEIGEISLVSSSFLLGIISGHLYDLSLGNYHSSSFLILSFILALISSRILRFELVSSFFRRHSLSFLLAVILINAILHIIHPGYVTELMVPAYPEL